MNCSPLTTIPDLPPTSSHNGLTVVLSRPNRYELANGYLLAGPPGVLLKNTLAANNFDPAATHFTTVANCDYPKGNKILLLGDQAHARFTRNAGQDLSAARGWVRGETVEWASTFAPVDCEDIVDFEGELYGDDADSEGEDANSFKDSAPTRRANYRFWFESDIAKLLRRDRRRAPKFISRQLLQDNLIAWLTSAKNQHLVLDIETHPASECVQCLGLCNAETPHDIISVPVYNHRGEAMYNLAKVFAALTRAFAANTIVAHNVMFDIPFLAHFHGVPPPRHMADTMLMHHRAFPEAEKSLAHLISYWLNLPSHKGDGVFHCYSAAQYDKLLAYNAADVAVTAACYQELSRHAATVAGLRQSMDSVNASIGHYTLSSLTGYNVARTPIRTERLAAKSRAAQLSRVFKILTGVENPASPAQIGQWLYAGLSYPVMNKTESGTPSTDAKTLYQLTAKYPTNVALRILLQIRDVDKTSSMLEFEPLYTPESRQ